MTLVLCRITRREAEHLGMYPAVAGGWVGVADDLRHAADYAAARHGWRSHDQLIWHLAMLPVRHSHARSVVSATELATILGVYAAMEERAATDAYARAQWTPAVQAIAAELRALPPPPSADESAIMRARCPQDHSGSHLYDVAPTATGRIAGECRGCHGSISADEAHGQHRR